MVYVLHMWAKVVIARFAILPYFWRQVAIWRVGTSAFSLWSGKGTVAQ